MQQMDQYLGNRWVDLCQIHTEDLFGPLLRQVLRSKVEVTMDKNALFTPITPRQPRNGTCSVQMT